MFFDLETTGLRPDRGATITEIALVDADRTRLHWRTDAPGASSLQRALLDLLGRLADQVVVGHHLAFDLRFLTYEARRHTLTVPRFRYVDTLGMARRLLATTGQAPDDFRLETLLRGFDLLPDAPLHQALVDARATCALFWRLVDEGHLQTLADAGAKPLAWTAP